MGQKDKKHEDSPENLNKILNAVSFSDVLGTKELPFFDKLEPEKGTFHTLRETNVKVKRGDFDEQFLEQFINTGSLPRSYSVAFSGEDISLKVKS